MAIVSYTLLATPFVVGLVPDRARAEHDSNPGDLMWDVQCTFEDDAPAMASVPGPLGIPVIMPKPRPEPQHFRIGANTERELHDAIVARANGDALAVGDPVPLTSARALPTLSTLVAGKTVKAADEPTD